MHSCSATPDAFHLQRAVLPSQLAGVAKATTYSSLLHGFTTTSLWEEGFFQRRPVHVSSAGQRGRFDSLFTLAHLDEVLEQSAAANGPMKNFVDVALLKRVVRDGQAWSGRWGTENQSMHVGTLKAGFNAGYTLLLNALEARDATVARLCQSVEIESLIPCNVNLYLTPSGAQGFDAHYDWMDAIVMQLEGAKAWVT